MISISEAIQRTVEHREIFKDEMVDLWRALMEGKFTPAQMAGLTIGLRVKKETVGEIAGAATVMRQMAQHVVVDDPASLLDIVGTGGDGAQTFNISTTSMFVIAACGTRVAKHGNRSVSSKSGAADVLEALGAHIQLNAEQVARCINEIHMGFLFAPMFHSAMRIAAPIRKELGIKTIFNILGPLTNPANAGNILMGVFHPDLVGICARVMMDLGAKHAVVVWGMDGLDEVTLGGYTMVADMKDGVVKEYKIHPEDYGLPMAATRRLRVANPQESLAMMMGVLNNEEGAPRESVIFNAGVGLYAANAVPTIEEGIVKARQALESGAAKAKMEEYVRETQKFAQK